MTLMGGAADSETLIGGYIWTIGGCSTPQKQPRENAGVSASYVWVYVNTHEVNSLMHAQIALSNM